MHVYVCVTEDRSKLKMHTASIVRIFFDTYCKCMYVYVRVVKGRAPESGIGVSESYRMCVWVGRLVREVTGGTLPLLHTQRL